MPTKTSRRAVLGSIAAAPALAAKAALGATGAQPTSGGNDDPVMSVLARYWESYAVFNEVCAKRASQEHAQMPLTEKERAWRQKFRQLQARGDGAWVKLGLGPRVS